MCTPVLQVENPLQSRIISLLLRHLKTEQVGRGMKVILGRTGHYLCPEAAALDYLGSRGSDPGLLFRWSNGRLLTRTHLEKGRVVLTCQPRTSKASFHIGAATTAKAVGVEDLIIQAIGRWNVLHPSLPKNPSRSFEC